jgi:hypothetical protein
MSRHLFVLLLFITIGSCTRSSDSDPTLRLAEALRVALNEIERHGGQVVVVVPDVAPATTRAAIGTMRKTIRSSEVSQTPELSLPVRHFLLEDLTIKGELGHVRGVLGPVLRNHNMSCGTGYDIDLRAEGASWIIVRSRLHFC